MRGAREAAREDEGVIQQPIHRRAAFADCHKVSFETSCQQQNPPRLDARAFLKPAGHLFLSITAQHPEDADVIQQHIHRWMGLNGKTGLTQPKPKSPAGFDFREKFWPTPKIGMPCTRQPITSSVQTFPQRRGGVIASLRLWRLQAVAPRRR